MALDKNLFTLNIEASKIEHNAVDLTDPSGTIHYRKRWVPNEAGTYLIALLDPLSDSVLATAAAPSATSKEKAIELHNPSVIVPLTFKGTITFKWGFAWEQHEFQWKREACYMIRKPDPPVLVAVTKEPAGKIKTSTVQILDYNLNRFDIDDRKGLEIVLLTSLLTFADQSDQLRTKGGEGSTPSPAANIPQSRSVPPPAPPPKPEGWKGDEVAILQAKEQRDVNEVVVGVSGEIDDYAKHCVSLLNDDDLLFITLRSQSSECVSKVVQVAEATKRIRYKSGAYDEELHQYVDVSFEDDPATKGKNKGKGPPRVINLDDRPSSGSAPTPSSKAYKPPSTLTIHLSKIAMPELEPKAKKGQRTPGSHSKISSEPKPPKETRHRKQSSTGPALTKPRPASPPPQSNGLRAKFNALTTRSSSPPPGARPSSAPHTQPPSHTTSQSRPPHANGQSPPPSHPQRPPQQQLHPPPPRLQHAHSNPQFAPPYPNSQQPTPMGRPQSIMYAPAGYPPFPGPGPMNAGPAYAMHPSSFGAPPGPLQPVMQRPAGTGILNKLWR